MIPNSPTITVPLQTDEHGVIRVSGTRVTLDVVIARFQQGANPEEIHERFDVLPVNDIYAVIAYYLAHRDELDAYIQRGEEEAERMRQEIEANYTSEQRKRNDQLKRLVEEKHLKRAS